ncbi:hypothetical protein [Paracoccus aminovorans]|uniref:hypothetical protein n=1 Tax=Paracoccus aminovorans TaxID=34004 RepID=UPI000783F059|nr:hypothetical protein [Paracoccus aminovorans]
MSDWQPIETCPDYGEPFIATYRNEDWRWVPEICVVSDRIRTTAGDEFPATHWTPLPKPPQPPEDAR